MPDGVLAGIVWLRLAEDGVREDPSGVAVVVHRELQVCDRTLLNAIELRAIPDALVTTLAQVLAQANYPGVILNIHDAYHLACILTDAADRASGIKPIASAREPVETTG